MMRDDKWCTKVLNTFIAAVESLEEVQRAPMTQDGPNIMDPTYQRQLETQRRVVRSEFTSAAVALNQVIHDWRDRKPGLFTSTEAHRKELAQEAVALVERHEEHAAHSGVDHPPELQKEQLHPWVWGDPVPGLWRTGHHRQAIAAAVEAVIRKIQERTGYDESGVPLLEKAFNVAEPKVGSPRLMLLPYTKSETYRNVQNGAKSLGQACVAGLRNPTSHGNHEKLDHQMALEQLAMISVLARWVEQAEVVGHSDDDDVEASHGASGVDFVKVFEDILQGDDEPQ